MRAGKRILAGVLAAVLLLGVLLVPVGAAGENYVVDKRPTIIIHGIGQSEAFLYDDAGNKVQQEDGSYLQGWPPVIDPMDIVAAVALPLIATLLFQFDFGLTSAMRKAVNNIFTLFKMDENGLPVQNMQVQRYPNSVAETDEAGQNFIYNSIPLQGLADVIGPENLYYFAYDSFGNNAAVTKELYEMIQRIKTEKGVDKVNLIPISLGGTIMNSLVATYPDVKNDLQSVVYIIPALDGSRIVGDLFLRNLSVSNEELYRDMIPGLVDGYLGGLLNIVIRLLPKSVVKGLLNSVLDGLVGDVISYSTTMWSLVPSGDYEAARKLWLEDGKHDEIRKQTDAYWQAQKDSRKNIEDMVKLGVHVYDIVDYDVQLLSIVGSYKDQNADGIIHLDSTSMGCTAAKVGETLPVGYKQAVSDGHNHLSPDGVLDASTGTLPDNTFYFKGQTHEGTSKNDVIMRLTTRLVTATEYETVFSMPGEYEQFSYKRETKGLRNDLLPIAKKVDTTDLSAEDKAALAEAIADVERALEPTIVTPGDVEAAGARLEAVLVKIGVRNAPEPDYASMILDPIGWFLNQAFYYLWGPRGFSDGLLSIWLQ